MNLEAAPVPPSNAATPGVASRLGDSHDDLGHLPGEILAPAIHDVYYGAAAAAVLLVVAVMFMPNRVTEMPRD